MKQAVRRIIGISYLLSFLLIGIIAMPILANIFTLIQRNDILISPSSYQKKTILMDSIDFYRHKSRAISPIGYAKELNNYKTKIIFEKNAQVENFSDSSYFKNDKKNYMVQVWYKKGSKYAYPTKKTEKIFPVKRYIIRYLDLLPFWILCFLLNRIIKYIMDKSIRSTSL